MAEAKTIYCPLCDRKMFEYDGRATIPIDAGCIKCRKRVVYFPDIDVTRITDIPLRKSTSGKRFWY